MGASRHPLLVCVTRSSASFQQLYIYSSNTQNSYNLHFHKTNLYTESVGLSKIHPVNMLTPRGPVLDSAEAQLVQDLTQWLQPTDYRSPGGELMKHVRAYMPGTGDWVRKTPEYVHWVDADADTKASPPNGCFWIKGVPGSGKSVVSGRAVCLLEELNPETPVLFFFFRQIVQKNHDPANLVRDYAAQLLPFSASLRASISQLKSNKSRGFDQDVIWDATCTAMDELDRVYCIADALDEMDNESFDFINKLKALGNRQPNKIKVLLTSRPIPKLEAALQEQYIASLRLEPTKIYPDITKYVKKSMASLVPRLSLETESRVTGALCEAAKGLFLHARLLMDNLEEGLKTDRITEESLPASLEKLPGSLTALYEEMLKEHASRSGVDQQEQVRILACVINSERRLRVLELGSLLAQMRGKPRELKEHKALVYESCGRLLEVQTDETVSVIHHSFTEFLCDESRSSINDSFPVLDSERAHRNLAIACFEYLADVPFTVQSDERGSFSDRTRAYRAYKPRFEKEFLEWPLADYAFHHWIDHILALPQNDTVALGLLAKYVYPRKLPFDMTGYSWSLQLNKTSITNLHVAAERGLAGYAEMLLDQDHSLINIPDESGRTPIMIAIKNGNHDVVEVLMQNGADLHHVDDEGYQAIHHVTASYRASQLSILTMLLKAGIHPFTMTKIGRAKRESKNQTLRSATQMMLETHSAPEQLFLECIPYLSPKQLSTCFEWAHRALHIEKILRTGLVHVDTKYHGRTKLFQAAHDLNTDAIRLLLQYGADPNRRCSLHGDSKPIYSNRLTGEEILEYNNEYGPTPVHALAGYQYQRWYSSNYDEALLCLDMLVEAGGNVNSVCDKGYQDSRQNYTPLHLLAETTSSRIHPIIKRLVHHGANINAQNYEDATAAHIAASGERDNDLSTVMYLHELGADLKLKNSQGLTPYLASLTHPSGISMYDDRKLAELIAKDPNCHFDICGNGILYYIFQLSTHTDTAYERTWQKIPLALILKLMAAGVDINQKNNNGQTPIFAYHCVNYEKDIGVFKQLIENGLDVQAIDNDGCNVILAATGCSYHGSYSQSIPLWVGLGVDPNIQDNDGNTAIHRAINAGHNLDVIKVLINNGVDATKINNKGQTTIVVAAHQRRGGDKNELIAYLESLGVPPLKFNENGQSRLQLALAAHTFDLSPTLERHLAEGISIDHLDNFGIAPLHYAAACNRIGVTLLLEANAQVDLFTPLGLSALHIAAFSRLGTIQPILEYYKALGRLEAVIDLRDKTEFGTTALHYACSHWNGEVVYSLLQHGADANPQDAQGLTPIHSIFNYPCSATLSPDRDSHEIHRFVEPWPNVDSPNAQSMDDRRPDIIHHLVTAGADINYRASIDGVMMTPLDRAIALGSTNIALELIRHGAVPTNPDTVANMDLSKHQEHLDRLLRLHDDVLAGDTGKQYHHPWHVLESEFTKVVSSGYHSAAVAFLDQVPTRSDLTTIRNSALRVLVSLIHQGQTILLRRLGKSVKEHLVLEEKLPDETKLLNTVFSANIYQFDLIQLLVDHFQAPTNTSPHPLHSLVHYVAPGSAAPARYLIEHGAVVDVMDTSTGMTPLMRVLSHDTPLMELVEVFLAHGANPNAVSANGSQSTLTLCKDPDALRLLFAHGADAQLDVHAGALVALLTLRTVPPPKVTETMRLLIEAGQDLNSAFEGRYPLLSAARETNFWHPCGEEKAEECCAAAIECGADMSKQLTDGRSIIQVVLEEHGLAKPFLRSPNLDMEARGLGGRTMLISTCKPFPSPGPREDSKSLKTVVPWTVDMLLDRGADTGAVDDIGRTALHWLCTIEAEAGDALRNLVVRLIQSNPAAVLAKDKEGYTPLHLASKHQQPDIMDILIDNGGDVFELDPRQNSALHWLAPRLVKPPVYARYTYECTDKSTDATKMIEYFKGLVAKGLDINQVNSEGRTPLFGFVSADPDGALPKRRLYAEPFKIFRKHAANLSHQDAEGQNVLHILAGQRLRSSKKKVWLFKELLRLGANPRQENNKLQTAIDIASTTSNYGVLDLFRPELVGNATATDDSDIACSEDESYSNTVPKKGDESSKVEEASDNESEPGYEVVDMDEVDTVLV